MSNSKKKLAPYHLNLHLSLHLNLHPLAFFFKMSLEPAPPPLSNKSFISLYTKVTFSPIVLKFDQNVIISSTLSTWVKGVRVTVGGLGPVGGQMPGGANSGAGSGAGSGGMVPIFFWNLTLFLYSI